MTTIPSHLPPIGPSPSRNPFARPKLGGTSSNSFTRKSLLPSVLSPAKPISKEVPNGLVTPSQKTTSGSATKARSAWRLLWRGGLEIGNEGWRLDGITFFASLTFPPPTPSNKEINPFDVPITHTTPGTSTPGGGMGSPFPLTNGDTDLCLSLESMRGRKYLQVRGMVDLPPEEVLEGESETKIYMSISPQATLLAAYFTGLLCRSEKLNENGRTLNAIMIGLGDEGIDSSNNSTILVYGQKQESIENGDSPGILKLCVGRRKPPPPPPSEKKVRPGEPLPRAPLFFPAKAPKKPPPLFPSRSLSRTSSVSSSIYHPPVSQGGPSAPAPAPISGRTPGRRGEKRPRKMELADRDDDEEGDKRKRKSGKIVLDKTTISVVKMEHMSSSSTKLLEVKKEEEGSSEEEEEEDIFGKRSKSITPVPSLLMRRSKSADSLGGPNSNPVSDDGTPNGLGAKKRVRVPQQVLHNKAAIRKQTLLLLEDRNISRTNELFKDIFGMITKSTYFVFRDKLHTNQITKPDIHRIINTHLDMYLPSTVETDTELMQGEEDIDIKPERLVDIREEEKYHEVKLEGTFLQSIHTNVKLESVVEEEEGDS
uniref:Sld7 C-terminal domain-containing protein n=1 Tax=Kwoniella bestiolae CBS 10118 TaxID=1296100 RepID=A0A1B9GEP3_9TREE|nr:hypothetical protein I302_01013 [Kwoniella bestiolae CBS 10118]OCF29506.1 hypothetical protein I302_01013 [Kwoniella bestiolae CBS 10118]